MTREKEIEQAMKESVAETIYAGGYGMTPQATDLLECAFTKGAEWADEHPKEGLISIEKAKIWVRNAFAEYFGNELANNIADDFIKAMEK